VRPQTCGASLMRTRRHLTVFALNNRSDRQQGFATRPVRPNNASCKLSINEMALRIKVVVKRGDITSGEYPLCRRLPLSEPIPSKPRRLVADIDNALEQPISTFRNESVNRTYINTASQMISGEELRQRNKLGGSVLDFRLTAVR